LAHQKIKIGAISGDGGIVSVKGGVRIDFDLGAKYSADIVAMESVIASLLANYLFYLLQVGY